MADKSLLDSINDMANNPAKYVNSVHTTTAAVLEHVKALKEQLAVQKELDDEFSKANPAIAKMVKGLRDTAKKTKQTTSAIEEMGESLDELATRNTVLKNMFPNQDAKGVTDNLKDVEDEIASLEAKLRDKPFEITEKDFMKLSEKKKILKDIDDITKKVMRSRDQMREANGSGGLFGISKNGFGALKSQFKDSWHDPKKMQQMAQSIQGSGMLDKGVGKLAGGMVGKIAAGGLAAKAIPVVGQVYTALDLANTAITSLDNYRKEANQAYAGLAGPQMSGEGFGKRSTSYNKSIRNVGFNMEMGMGAEDWNAMFQSMKGAGIGVDQLSNSLGNQKDVMRSVRETGIALGTSTDVMAESYASLALESKSGLQSIQDGFEDVARGAQKAGIISDKFYSIIQASVLAMGSYGNFVGMASGALSKLSKTAGISMQEASDATNKMVSSFKDMSSEERLQYVGLLTSTAGGASAVKSQADKTLTEIAEQLKNPALKADEREALEVKQFRIQKGLAKGNDPVALQGILAELSGGASAFNTQMMQDVYGGRKALYSKMGTEADLVLPQLKGMDQAQVKMFKDVFFSVGKDFEPIVGQLSKAVDAQANEGLVSSLASTLENGKDMTDEQRASALSQTETLAKAAGLNQEQTKDLIKYVKNQPIAMSKVLKKGVHGGFGVEDLAAEAASSITDDRDTWSKEQVKGQTDIIKELTPMQKLFDITKDSIFYNMAASDAAVGSAKALMDIKSKIYSWAAYAMGSDTEAEDASSAVESTSNALTKLQNDSQAILDAENEIKGMTPEQLRASFTSGGAAATVAKSLGIGSADKLGSASDLVRASKTSRIEKMGTARDEHNLALQKLDEVQTDKYNSALGDLYLARSSNNQVAEKTATDSLKEMGYSAEAIEAALDQIPWYVKAFNQAANATGTQSMYQAVKTGDIGEIIEQGLTGGILGRAIKGGISSLMSDDTRPGASGTGTSNRTLSVGTMNITQPTDTNGIMNMFKRQEFNAMAK